METAYQQYGISNDAVALYRCPEERCRGTGRIPAGSGGKVSSMWKYQLFIVGNTLAGTYVPEGAWIDLGVFYSKVKPESSWSDRGLFGPNRVHYVCANLIWI